MGLSTFPQSCTPLFGCSLLTQLLILVLVLCCLLSVLSAVSGLSVATSAIQKPAIVGISVAVLVLLFSVQRLGTGKVSAAFAPVITVWLLFNAALGLYNLSTCGWAVWQVGCGSVRHSMS